MRRMHALVWLLTACGGTGSADAGGTTSAATAGDDDGVADTDASASTSDTTASADDATDAGDETNDATGTPECGDDPDCVEIAIHQVLELGFQASAAIPDPFDTYLLRLRVESPDGTMREVDGYYDGQDTRWRARLTCDVLGTWQWETIAGDAPDAALVGRSGELVCVDGPDLGGVVADGRAFRLAEGDPIYLVGNFLDLTLQSTHVFMSEDLDDAARAAILQRQADVHRVNKMNVYFANVGDYGGDSVTPWTGDAADSDKSQMDVARWALYDGYIRDIKGAAMLAEMWFFADDSAFGDNDGFAIEDHQRLMRYAMARTSAFSHALFVVALEWQEGFSQTGIETLGTWLATHNPWGRPLSVHSLTGSDWAFAASTWPSFIATQGGNDAMPADVNAYGMAIRGQDARPHVDEEFGLLESDSNATLRGNLWANLASGAAGGGTGSELAALQAFLADSRMPFQRMEPRNELVSDGGNARFCLAEVGHHYLVYTTSGGFDLALEGEGLVAAWYDPRDANAVAIDPQGVAAGTVSFTPPSGEDWVLWVSDASELGSGVTHPTVGVNVTVIEVL